jgi:hypothetical protein
MQSLIKGPTISPSFDQGKPPLKRLLLFPFLHQPSRPIERKAEAKSDSVAGRGARKRTIRQINEQLKRLALLSGGLQGSEPDYLMRVRWAEPI